MRKIRFRAWDGQRFYYFGNHAYTLDFNDMSGWNVRPNTPNYHREKWTTGESSESAEAFDLQQFTGIEDKDGKWIYEGDILQIVNPFSDTWLARVLWGAVHPEYVWMIGETWMVQLFSGHTKGENTPLYPYCQPEHGLLVTVIGNIHQNPELLPEVSSE